MTNIDSLCKCQWITELQLIKLPTALRCQREFRWGSVKCQYVTHPARKWKVKTIHERRHANFDDKSSHRGSFPHFHRRHFRSKQTCHDKLARIEISCLAEICLLLAFTSEESFWMKSGTSSLPRCLLWSLVMVWSRAQDFFGNNFLPRAGRRLSSEQVQVHLITVESCSPDKVPSAFYIVSQAES